MDGRKRRDVNEWFHFGTKATASLKKKQPLGKAVDAEPAIAAISWRKPGGATEEAEDGHSET